MPIVGIVLVAGVPGVGKTTLIQQLKEETDSFLTWSLDELVPFHESIRSSYHHYRQYLYDPNFLMKAI
jgi:adenylate kinase